MQASSTAQPQVTIWCTLLDTTLSGSHSIVMSRGSPHAQLHCLATQECVYTADVLTSIPVKNPACDNLCFNNADSWYHINAELQCLYTVYIIYLPALKHDLVNGPRTARGRGKALEIVQELEKLHKDIIHTLIN